jgi:hypothetical protein
LEPQDFTDYHEIKIGLSQRIETTRIEHIFVSGVNHGGIHTSPEPQVVQGACLPVGRDSERQ